jgi:pyridoxine/pyridoxamine 5'-phosphate oxidase
MTKKQAYRPKSFCETYNISLSLFYKEVKAGRLTIKKIGRVSLVSAEAADEWFESRPDYTAAA